MIESIGRLVQQVPVYTAATTGQAVYTYFEENKNAEGIVVIDAEKPAGLIMRNDFYQKIGKQCGYALYMNRPVTRVMNENMLIVDASVDVVDVSIMAMNREQENLYDLVVVEEGEKYLGVVSIKLFLVELAKKREKEIELLKQQQEILKMAHEAEKQHVIQMEEKNNELNLRNTSVKNLLDNAGQGFLSFGCDMVISDEYSLECMNIFNKNIGNMNYIDLIEQYVYADTIKTIHSIFDSVFRNTSRLGNKVYLSLLPKELNIDGKFIKFEYKIINDYTSKKVMIILTDITDKKEMEAKMLEEKNNLKLIVKVLSGKSDIHMTMEDYKDFFENRIYDLINRNVPVKEILREVFRMVHTFKGDFSQYYMHNTAGSLHILEDSISDMLNRLESFTREDILKFAGQIDYNSYFEKDLLIITETLGNNYFTKSDYILADIKKIREIEEKVKTLFAPEQTAELISMLQNLRYSNLKESLLEYDETVKSLAQSLGKDIGSLVVTGDDVYVDRDKYFRLLKSLTHIFRNSIDHGIEPAGERNAKGKPETGKIECILEKKNRDAFAIIIRDDGRGIDLNLLKSKAVESGIINENEASGMTGGKLMELIYTDQFSTKEDIGMISGRGVGLSAVKSEVIRMGGEISVSSEINRGTEFKITLPLR